MAGVQRSWTPSGDWFARLRTGRFRRRISTNSTFNSICTRTTCPIPICSSARAARRASVIFSSGSWRIQSSILPRRSGLTSGGVNCCWPCSNFNGANDDSAASSAVCLHNPPRNHRHARVWNDESGTGEDRPQDASSLRFPPDLYGVAGRSAPLWRHPLSSSRRLHRHGGPCRLRVPHGALPALLSRLLSAVGCQRRPAGLHWLNRRTLSPRPGTDGVARRGHHCPLDSAVGRGPTAGQSQGGSHRVDRDALRRSHSQLSGLGPAPAGGGIAPVFSPIGDMGGRYGCVLRGNLV